LLWVVESPNSALFGVSQLTNQIYTTDTPNRFNESLSDRYCALWKGSRNAFRTGVCASADQTSLSIAVENQNKGTLLRRFTGERVADYRSALPRESESID
jgi:hypothetical protein